VDRTPRGRVSQNDRGQGDNKRRTRITFILLFVRSAENCDCSIVTLGLDETVVQLLAIYETTRDAILTCAQKLI